MKSYLADYIAQQRLNLQQESNHLSRQKMNLQQSNFERKMQADWENEQRRNETSLNIAQIQAQNHLESIALNNLLQSINQRAEFFQNELAKQTAHNLEMQKTAYETRANSILERLKNNAEINKLKLQAKIEIERMIMDNELKKEYLSFYKYCDLFFRLLERDLGLNAMEQNAENIEAYVRQAFEQMSLDK